MMQTRIRRNNPNATHTDVALTLPISERAATKVHSPPRKWRNLWRFKSRVVLTLSGRIMPPGEWLGETVYPSREVAEQRALDAVAHFDRQGKTWGEYLGPLHEGQW